MASVRDVIYWPEIDNLDNIASVRGGNPILFPFSGRSYDRGEIHHWRADDGVRRPMPMHGCARQGQFRITRLDRRRILRPIRSRRSRQSGLSLRLRICGELPLRSGRDLC